MEIFAVLGALVSFLISIAYVVFAIAAIISILRSTNYTGGLKALWILAVIAFPFLGSLIWFLVGRNSRG